MDCFYAQVEMRDNPKLRGIPIAIGGPSKTKGVLCTSNYEAREYGVRAAMPTIEAFKKCPKLTLIPPDFKKYKEASRIIHQIFLKYTDKVESLSLDEAYLDVTETSHNFGSATDIAKLIKKDIYKQTGLTSSAGVSFNKMIAKIASDWNKPNGLTIIRPDDRSVFMANLPLGKIPGIGPLALQKFHRLGFYKCEDITNKDIYEIISIFGKKNGIDLYEKCHGISNSIVSTRSKRKAFSLERSYFEFNDLEARIDDLLDEFCVRFQNIDPFHLENREISHIKVKVRTKDFDTYTREQMINIDHSDNLIKENYLIREVRTELRALLSNTLKSLKIDEIRLLGVGFKFIEKRAHQIEFSL